MGSIIKFIFVIGKGSFVGKQQGILPVQFAKGYGVFTPYPEMALATDELKNELPPSHLRFQRGHLPPRFVV